jgi:hypothetical protein
MGDLGVVTSSFGLRLPDEEPDPCNVRLARAAHRVLDTSATPVVLVSRRAGVRRVVAVAQPLLHRAKAHRPVREDGFEPVRQRLGWIGSDSSRRNTQWWTRGPLRLLAHALVQSSTGRAGR